MGENFKFQIQDIFLFLNIFWGEIGRFEKQIALSEKKASFNTNLFYANSTKNIRID